MKLLRRVSLLFLIGSVALSVLNTDETGKTTVSSESMVECMSGNTDELPLDDFTPKRGNNSPLKEKITPTASNVSAGWYCKHMKDGARPPLPAEMNYIEKYDGFFLGKDEKVIYLTFDAGYENGNVEKILDVLKAEEVPAAFFILENLAEKKHRAGKAYV